MNWRFWRCRKRKRPAKTRAQFRGDKGKRESASGLLMSAAELVSLQRLVGNRAVVNLLKKN